VLDPGLGLGAGTLLERAEATLERGARRLDDEVPRRLVSVPESSVPRALRDVAIDERADLIVLGACHRGMAGRALGLGTAQRLLRDAPCAVAIAAPPVDQAA
jgi:nucleotide-binding universal stress UspA family protein